MLGRYLASGAAGEPDRVEARTWLERAAAQGIPEAETALAEFAAPHAAADTAAG
jgi:TPR repeat protein